MLGTGDISLLKNPKQEVSMRKNLIYVVFLTFALIWGGKVAYGQDLSSIICEHFIKKTQITSLPKELTMEEAYKIQKAVVSSLEKDYGKVVGYKAGLTNPKAQEAFGVREPVLGVLFEKMLLKSGSKVPANFGARPVSEGDLIVRIGDEKINDAKDSIEAVAFIEEVIPFIELPDLMYAPDVKLNGPMIVAINVGARLGIVGDPVKISGEKEWIQRLKAMQLEIYDEKNEKIAEGTGAALMGDPMAVVLWIRDQLKKEGKTLKKGDLLSLGTITKMVPVKAGGQIKARYTGLDPKGPVEIMVQFQ